MPPTEKIWEAIKTNKPSLGVITATIGKILDEQEKEINELKLKVSRLEANSSNGSAH